MTTTLIPLDEGRQPRNIPAFVSHAKHPATGLERVVKAILKARRIAVVCGAGISVQAGIPDFRSAHGLFQSLKKENPKENISSGKDLFDASVFNSESSTSLFCHMMARLSRLSEDATPSPFHNLLKELDRRGKLQRVYTQNIDALEQKAGMTFGVPERTKQSRTKATPKSDKRLDQDDSQRDEDIAQSSTFETPRCVPLHGTLQTMHCISCNHTVPLNDYLATLSEGTLPECPNCATVQETRSANGMRLRTVGKLRPSVVLYNEEHRDGEDVGSVVERDLPGRRCAGPDLLLVVGTSLRVPGTKRIVREFSKAVRTREEARLERVRNVAQRKAKGSSGTGDEGEPVVIPSPTPSPRRSPAPNESGESAVTSVYLNLDFPLPSREWEGVFDAWVQGDAQSFADMIRECLEQSDREREEKARKEQVARDEREEKRKQKQINRQLKEARKALKAMTTEAKIVEKQVKTPGKKRSNQKEKPLSTGSNPAKRRKVTLHVKDPTPSTYDRPRSPHLAMHHRSVSNEESSSSQTPNASSSTLRLYPSQHPSLHSYQHRDWDRISDYRVYTREEPLPYHPFYVHTHTHAHAHAHAHAHPSSHSSYSEKEEDSEESANETAWHARKLSREARMQSFSSSSLLTPLSSPTLSCSDLPQESSFDHEHGDHHPNHNHNLSPSSTVEHVYEPPPGAPKRKRARRRITMDNAPDADVDVDVDADEGVSQLREADAINSG